MRTKMIWEKMEIKVEEYLADLGYEIIDGGIGWIKITDGCTYNIVEEEPGIFYLKKRSYNTYYGN